MAEEGTGDHLSFDDKYRVRVLDPSAAERAEALQAQASAFSKSASKLLDAAKDAVSAAETRAHRTEQEKLRAIGARNAFSSSSTASASLQPSARKLQLELELARLQRERSSVEKMCEEQELLIAHLSDPS